MNGSLHLRVNGIEVDVPIGASVAAAIARITPYCHRSPRGDLRGPLCGMGVCFECRVCVNGTAYVLACITSAQNGMEVTTDG
ncbi:MAG TPA: 2Fe-2S iron-sulfur cluster-binding protein [Gammaproteobacteria bacterium]|nr:2Fe-2S iron-sulfur cluster-binding protein [Gammaproteobacteria bacterium]